MTVAERIEISEKASPEFIKLQLKNNNIDKLREIEDMLDIELSFRSLGYCSASGFSLLGVPETSLYCIVKKENYNPALNLIKVLLEKYQMNELIEIE